MAEGPIVNEINNVEESVKMRWLRYSQKVLAEFSKYGEEVDLLTFFQLVSENRFPFSNITFQI